MSTLMENTGTQLTCDEQVNIQLAIAMKQICESARIGRSEFENAFTGITYATWRNYLNPDYKNSRSVSALAALSWYTGVSMNSFYLGDQLCTCLGVTQEGLSLLTLMNQLNGDAFEMACQLAFGHIDDAQKDSLRPHYLKARLLHKEVSDLCPCPRPLDVEVFSRDYQYSCAVGIRQLQAERRYSDEHMATVLGVSPKRYSRLRDPDDMISISATVAIRFKIGFQLDNTAFILDNMKQFPEFAHLRRFQDSRDQVVLPLLSHLSPEVAVRLHGALRQLFVSV